MIFYLCQVRPWSLRCAIVGPISCGALIPPVLAPRGRCAVTGEVPWRGMAERLGMRPRGDSYTATGEEVARYAVSREDSSKGRARTTSVRVAR